MAELLGYGFANGVHSIRKIERACYDLAAFHYVAADTHPDHDPLATFRGRFLKELDTLFVHAMVLARKMKACKRPHREDPEPPQAGPQNGDQVDPTNEASRMMPAPGDGVGHSYSAQASGDLDTMMVITAHVTHGCHDELEVLPPLSKRPGMPH